MTCTRPKTAYWRSVHRDAITFDRSQSATKVPFQLPCGYCPGCRLDKAVDWGMRCVHEAKMWPDNCFVTLTYSNENLPCGGTLELRDVQLFMKRLRFAKKSCKANPLRFFLGAEYGEENGRPHYHALLFNCRFDDMLFHAYNKRQEPLYVSKELDELWGLGFCSIGALTYDSAVYCAKYALKKRYGDGAREAYQVYDEDGVIYDRRPEFAVMSRRPGIGRAYFDKYGNEIAAHDSVVINGRTVGPPRYYDTKVREQYGDACADLHARERKRKAVLNKSDNTFERLRVKERLIVLAAEKKERKL